MNTTTSSRVTLDSLRAMRAAGVPIAMLTCYDFPTARILQSAGIPILLVGDSAANTILGLPSTREIDPDFLLQLTVAVRRGAPDVFLLADMPYKSMASLDLAQTMIHRFLTEAHADAVKLETTHEDIPLVQSLLAQGFPLCIHLGLLPQHVTTPTGYKAQGRTADEAQRIISDALVLARAGASLLLLEAVPDEVSAAIGRQVDCPVLGCGAGPSCAGHVVVLHDLLGYNPKPPRFAEPLADAPALIQTAAQRYLADIRSRAYPAPRHQYPMKSGS